jgi:hypothetical protein
VRDTVFAAANSDAILNLNVDRSDQALQRQMVIVFLPNATRQTNLRGFAIEFLFMDSFPPTLAAPAAIQRKIIGAERVTDTAHRSLMFSIMLVHA